MNATRHVKSVLAGALIGAGALLAACASQPQPTATAESGQYTLAPAPPAAACLGCGVIAAIERTPAGDYLVTIHMENNSTRIIRFDRQPAFGVGRRVLLTPVAGKQSYAPRG